MIKFSKETGSSSKTPTDPLHSVRTYCVYTHNVYMHMPSQRPLALSRVSTDMLPAYGMRRSIAWCCHMVSSQSHRYLTGNTFVWHTTATQLPHGTGLRPGRVDCLARGFCPQIWRQHTTTQLTVAPTNTHIHTQCSRQPEKTVRYSLSVSSIQAHRAQKVLRVRRGARSKSGAGLD